MSRLALLLVPTLLLAPASAWSQSRERRVTLKDAVTSGIFNSPDVQEIAADRAIALVEVQRRIAALTPKLTFGLNAGKEKLFTQYGEQALDGLYEQSEVGGYVAVGGRGPYGGEYELRFEDHAINDLADRDYVRLNPLYTSKLALNFRQPLMRGAGYLGGLVEVESAKLGFYVAEADLRTRLQQVVGRIVERYWALARRIEEVKILQTNLAQAESLRKTVELRIKSGSLPPSAQAQADATAAARRKEVEIARLSVIDAEEAFLEASYLSTDQTFRWDEQIVPADDPVEEEVSMDVDEQLKLAIEHRPEIARADRALELAKQQLAIAENRAKLRLDAVAQAGLAGLGGTNVVRPFSVNTPLPGPMVREGQLGALGNMFSGEGPFGVVGVELELPFNNNELTGAVQQASLEVKKAEARRNRLQLQVQLRAALQQVVVATERLRVDRDAERLAALNVEAERQKFEAGESTTFDVLRTQDDYSRARAETFEARIARSVTVVNLEATRGTLLERFGIRIEDVAAATSAQ